MGLGWQLLRLWSTDWWVDKQGALQRLHESIATLLEASRMKERELLAVAQEPPVIVPPDSASGEVEEPTPATNAIAGESVPLPDTVIFGTYQVTDFSNMAASIHADQFYDESYDSTLKDLIGHVLNQESPILESLLVHRIARAHGFLKSGRIIRERVLEIVDRAFHLRLDPVGGQFIWIDAEASTSWSCYRPPASEDHARKVEEISFEELRAASAVSKGDDLPVEIARLFGIRRLASGGRDRLEATLKLSNQILIPRELLYKI
jgi:hypothetical protein